jgi:HEAT repeat protein
VADEGQEWELLDALLEKHPPGYERDPSKKRQILTHLAEIEDPSVPKTLARYLDDQDEGIRFFAAEQLIDFGDPASCEALVARLVHPEEDSLRLRTKILDGLADHRWDVSAYTNQLAAHIGHEHSLSGGKVVRR